MQKSKIYLSQSSQRTAKTAEKSFAYSATPFAISALEILPNNFSYSEYKNIHTIFLTSGIW
jgi:hypothetical protein